MVLIINHIVCLQTFRAHPEEVRQSGRGGGMEGAVERKSASKATDGHKTADSFFLHV